MNDQAPKNSPEENHLLEEDEVWSLLDKSAPPQAGPLFSRNILREIRLEESQPSRSFWTRLPWARFALPVALLFLIALGLVSIGPEKGNSPDSANSLANNTSSQGQESAPLVEALLEEELLIAAADHPELFSDEDLVALLF